MHKEWKIEGQGHTLGCMLRHRLFDNGATFAACVVPHPMDKHLIVKVEADDPVQCLESATHQAMHEIDRIVQQVDNYTIHKNLIQ